MSEAMSGDQYTNYGSVISGTLGGYPYGQAYTSTPYSYYTYYTVPRFSILVVGHDLVKLDTMTGETWQKDWYHETWKRVKDND